MRDRKTLTEEERERYWQADQARIFALLDWADEHGVNYLVLLAAAGVLLACTCAPAKVPKGVKLGQEIFADFATYFTKLRAGTGHVG
jgi:hypothetical protein